MVLHQYQETQARNCRHSWADITNSLAALSQDRIPSLAYTYMPIK